MKEGYFQARIRKEDRPKTAFMINAGSGARRLQYIRCPQGLSSSSDHFNTTTDKIFAPCQSFMMKIIDDILIFADSYSQLEERLRKVLSQARDNNVIFSKTKIQVGEGITFAGMRLESTSDGLQIKPDPSLLEAIRTFRRPRNITEVKSFCGLATQISCWNPDLSQSLVRMRELLKDKTPWDWTKEMEQEFNAAREQSSLSTKS